MKPEPVWCMFSLRTKPKLSQVKCMINISVVESQVVLKSTGTLKEIGTLKERVRSNVKFHL
jgi:hypothetical protein